MTDLTKEPKRFSMLGVVDKITKGKPMTDLTKEERLDLIEIETINYFCLIAREGAEIPNCHEYSKPRICDCNVLWLITELKSAWVDIKLLGIQSQHRWEDKKDIQNQLFESLQREKIQHMDMSAIRRATDDLPELNDINRMAREALAKVKELRGEK